ncbi:prenyltransferase [Proteiniclasticum sp.]|uniref:prenyltransferase n=1 Tax=Proteiniclasticum sp. TaxID=2053595 RepID=UPI00344D64A5
MRKEGAKWMSVSEKYRKDLEEICAHRYDLGGDLWTSEDKRILKGSPFSLIESVQYVLEIGMNPEDLLLMEVADLLFSLWREDGRFQVYPQGALYPCQTIHVLNTLCRLGYAKDKRLQRTFQHLLEIQHEDGGWRCKKFSYGHGPETEFSNPFPTLVALDAFRYTPWINDRQELDKAVEFLLCHWTTKLPLGPCHYGIGTLFSQVEYPFRTYTLFYYVYVLSYYDCAKGDPRFLDALSQLRSKTEDGQIVVERAVPKLSKLSFCKKGEKSALATMKYNEILKNLKYL